jgi:hypothetical protein
MICLHYVLLSLVRVGGFFKKFSDLLAFGHLHLTCCQAFRHTYVFLWLQSSWLEQDSRKTFFSHFRLSGSYCHAQLSLDAVWMDKTMADDVSKASLRDGQRHDVIFGRTFGDTHVVYFDKEGKATFSQ